MTTQTATNYLIYNVEMNDFERGMRQAALMAKVAYMLRHDDERVAQLLHDVIVSQLANQ